MKSLQLSPRSPREAGVAGAAEKKTKKNRSPRSSSPRGAKQAGFLSSSLGIAGGKRLMISPRRHRRNTAAHLARVEDHLALEDQYDYVSVVPRQPADQVQQRFAAGVVSTYVMLRRSNTMLYCVEFLLIGQMPQYCFFSLEEVKQLRQCASSELSDAGIVFPPVKLRRDEKGQRAAQIARISAFFSFLVQSERVREHSAAARRAICEQSRSYANFMLEVRIRCAELPLLDATAQIHLDETLRLSKLDADSQAKLRNDPAFLKIMQRLACCRGIPPSDDAMFEIVTQTQLVPFLEETARQEQESRELHMVAVVSEHLKESGLPEDAQVQIMGQLSRKSKFDAPLQVVLSNMHKLIAETALQVHVRDITASLENVVERIIMDADKRAALYSSERFQSLLERALQPNISTKSMASILSQLKKLAAKEAGAPTTAIVSDVCDRYGEDTDLIQL